MDVDRGILVTGILVFGILSLLVVLSVLQYVLLAILLGYVLYPLYERLAPRVGSRVSAVGLIIGTALAISFPLGLLLTVAADQALQVLEAIQAGRLGTATIERFLQEQFGVSVDLERIIGTGGTFDELLRSVGREGWTALFGGVVNLLGSVSNVLIGITVLLFLWYYLLTHGAVFVRWLRRVSQLPDDVWNELRERVDRLLWAVLVGNVTVAIVQGVFTGIGLALVGFSNVVFWTLVTVILGLLPLLGASIVWVPAVGYLVLVGQPVTAALFFIYGATVVTISDDYLRPMIGGREANLNPGLFVVGIFGGLFVLGPMGVFFGPVVLGTLKVFVELFARERSSSGRRPSVDSTAMDNTSIVDDNDRRAS